MNAGCGTPFDFWNLMSASLQVPLVGPRVCIRVVDHDREIVELKPMMKERCACDPLRATVIFVLRLYSVICSPTSDFRMG